MSYIHDGKKPITAKADPIDPDGIDWVFFAYDNWLRDGETITTHEALIDGGDIVVDSTYLGDIYDPAGNAYAQGYGVKIHAAIDAKMVTVTHRKTTTMPGVVNLGRNDIDHSVKIPVKTL